MAATDLITASEASSFIGAPEAVDELTPWISAVSDRIDDLCGPVVQRTITNEVYDGGHRSIILRKRPVASVTTITERIGLVTASLTADTPSAVSATGYRLDLATGIVYRRASGYDYPFYPDRGNVIITYVAGRYASTSAVSARFKQAAKLCIKDLWQRHMGTGNPMFQVIGDDIVDTSQGWVIPRAAFDLLGLERAITVGMA